MAPLKRRIVASWIWLVFNPQIEHCEAELVLLAQTLTFRARNKRFERLKPLSEALLPDGQTVFDDMRGDVPEYDAIVAKHDGALADLLEAAAKLFVTLNRHQPFREQIAAARSEFVKAAGPGKADALHGVQQSELVAWEIENVINGLDGDLPLGSRIDAELWNGEHDRLKGLAAGAELTNLSESRARFFRATTATRDDLKSLRKKLSRDLDIPVAPTFGGLHEEALE